MSFGDSGGGPSDAQIQAQQTQERLARQQEAQLQQQETERLASIRARAGRMGGRSLLMMDETGFFTDRETGLQKRLGTGWRAPPTPTPTPQTPSAGRSLLGDTATTWLAAA